MKLALDIGNTRIKVGVFNKDNALIKHAIIEYSQVLDFIKHSNFSFTHTLVSDVKGMDSQFYNQLPGKLFKLTSDTSLPIKIDYKTPETLGNDRIANVLGARQLFPFKNCLIIDAGTCITYDIIKKNNEYVGGRISPGIQMRFKAMHQFTGKLPLIKSNSLFTDIGKSTIESMKSGVYGGLQGELNEYIAQLEQHFNEITVILSGGDIKHLTKMIKCKIFAAPNIILYGLINAYNHQKKS